jgi:spore germination protein YaaH
VDAGGVGRAARRAALACAVAIALVAAIAASPRAGRDQALAAAGRPAPCLFAFSSRLPDGGELRRFAEVGGRLSILAPNWYDRDRGAGSVRGAPAVGPLRDAAARLGTALWPVVNAQAGFQPLFGSPARRRASVRAIAALAGGERFAGITLDVEGVRPADRRELTGFVGELAQRLHRSGRRLAVYAVRRTAARPNRSSAAYDWRALVRRADLLLASGYNEHSARTEPGPITTPGGFRRMLRYAKTVSGRRAVPLGGAFGYRWPASGAPGRLVSTVDAEAQRRAQGAPPSVTDGAATYAVGGDRVWYETGDGLRARAAAARRARMRWFGLFSLGREPAGTLQGLPPGNGCARWAR